ncbi:polysaccharide pyruvyl transferase family protein [Antarcticibacterium sp. 1MA-6-2]|uniref:polysaccharide pyruvyl transferase family protein n=1 Tax=Antarcticibacterium sp. 1MA-6-2 TaxID=2908210 RepID=UPI001F1BAF32|nr:polysaccharide pyruvyl transferase family protein [Antarcticibacterium sp. 1MA-6-2]UJH92200.1 polysaccharide pyruvyl transferase family protein [Antarcticibacterium sp. 1MA-6-2]
MKRIFPFVKNLLTSPARSLKKREVRDGIINTPQKNRSIANIYRIDTDNVGDYYSSPKNYFKELGDIEVDIFDFKKRYSNNIKEVISNNSLVIGGGGLLNRSSFELQMKTFEQLKLKGKKTVLWGVGHNSKHKKDFSKLQEYNIDPNNFGLAGIRDYSLSKNWVPCVSCLNPVFDKKYDTTQEIGVVLHKSTLKNSRIPLIFQDFPAISNTENLEDFVNFIGSSETIITDSYHAMYWGVLLNRKVVVVPNSSKFFDFKYPPVISTYKSSIKDTRNAQSYTGALDDCRERNKKFSEQVFNYLNL